MIDQTANTPAYTSPYKFNGKELDDSTGMYYYGARYYDPRISVWMSVDPLAEKYHNWSPYNYCHNNPIRLIDFKGLAPSQPTNYEDEKGNTIAKTNDGSNDIVTITNDKLYGFMSSFKGTSEEARNSVEMNSLWKHYSKNNIKSNKLDPATLGRNYFGSNYIGPDNPQTFPDAKGNRKWDYTASPVNLADASAKTHDIRYDKLGIEGISGVLFDTRAIGADWRFVGSEINMAHTSGLFGDYKSVAQAYTSALLLGLGITGKTIIQLSTPNGASKTIMWDNLTK